MIGAVGGCPPRDVDLRVAMESYAPAERIRAIKEVAARLERQQVPGLVDRLDDEDVAVRIAAIVALEQMTGRRFGYDAWGPPESRIESVNAWRSLLAVQAAQGKRNGGTVNGGAPAKQP